MSLPIWAIHSEIVGTLRQGNRLVLVAPTGSGKTTQVPQMLLDAGLADPPSPLSPLRTPVSDLQSPNSELRTPNSDLRTPISNLPSPQSGHNPQSAIRNPQSAIRNPQSAPPSPQSAIRNPQSAISVVRNRIVVLQPRRVAARTVAARVASERNARLGDEVGYQIRFEDRTSLGTRICFVTEGILLRWLQDDRTLPDVAIILFDEFHERNLLSDVSLALVKHLQVTVRPDLKLAVMSATLEAQPVARYLDDCPILIAEGRTHPVETRFQDYHDERPIHEQAASAVERIVQAGEEGDILVFMPGMAEIQATQSAIRAASIDEPLALIPLHGDLPPEDQDRAFSPHPARKVVVATNVAETSVTIDGIRHVVDSGLARIARYDAERGLSTLLVETISRASAEQRKGRAGRTAPGTCHRLWTESAHLDRPEQNTPEIRRSDLAEVVLLLHSLGIRRAAQFDWLDKPDPQAVERAEKLLRTLGALHAEPPDDASDSDPRGSPDLTPIGRQMLRLPMHPRYSRLLVEASARGCVPQAALCAALVSGRDLLVRLSRDDKHISEARELFEANPHSDFYTLIRAYHFARNRGFSVEACRRYGLHAQTARMVDQTYHQLLDIARQQGLVDRALPDTAEDSDDAQPSPAVRKQVPEDPLLRCLLAGFVDQLCIRRDLGSLECDLTEGRTGTLVRESVVQTSPLFVAGSIREVPSRGSGNLTLLSLATAVKREWIEEMFPHALNSRIEHLYDRTHRRVAAIRLLRFNDLVIHHEHQRDTDPAATGRCLADAHRRHYFELPLIDHELKQFIARVNLVVSAMPDLEFPPLDEDALARCLARAFAGITTVKEAQSVPLRQALHTHLAPEQLAWLNELAPLTVLWHDGRKLKLLYVQDPDETPARVEAELQVKLHECFPLAQHPVLCERRVPVKLWLCAPDGKRLEATHDWPTFRTTAYPKLKPNLQRKYPGFIWV